MRITVAALLVFTLAGLCAEEAAKPAPPSQEAIAAWIKNLGSEEFQVREEAETQLRQIGPSIIPTLKDTAEKTEDAETRQRCERIVAELTAGPRIAQAIKEIDDADWEKAKKAIEVLMEELGKKHGAEEAIAKASKEGGTRGQMAQMMQGQINNIKQQKEQYARMAEERPEIAEQMKNAESQVEIWAKRNIMQLCQNLHNNGVHKKK